MMPLLLLILDGWGVRENSADNAISQAHTPQWDNWLQQGLSCTLKACGTTVGLPKQQMGNSEVGHMHIGAGRVIKQDLSQINDDISSGVFFNKATLIEALQQAKQQKNAIHLMGLLSDGGVHSHQQHLYALLDAINQQQLDNPIYIHAFLDGRDTAPNSAKQFIQSLQAKLKTLPQAKLASVCGRFYAMDRDNRWDRIEQSYQLLTEEPQHKEADLINFIEKTYQQQLYDEFIPPTATTEHQPLADDDLLLFFNFRSDRARQLSHALSQPDFSGFNRKVMPKIQLVTMTKYDDPLNAAVIYPPHQPVNTLGECLQNAAKHQLRIAETEKYAHVTFFFNGGLEAPFKDEDRILIPSPNVQTYDLQPEMSAYQVSDELIKAIYSKKYQLIVCNFANADMVGHTGNFEATKQAIEALDKCFIKINNALQACSTELILTADHGNAEQMFNAKTNLAHTAHTSEPVPFVYIGQQPVSLINTEQASLIDLAPTALSLMQLPIPKEMTGNSLLKFME